MKTNRQRKKANLTIESKKRRIDSSILNLQNQELQIEKDFNRKWDSEIKQIKAMLRQQSTEVCQEKMIELVLQKINVSVEEKKALSEFLKLYLDLSPISWK